MKQIATLLLTLCLLGSVSMNAQNSRIAPATKGDGQVFYYETFGWGNPADPKGWTAPAGFYMEDPDDTGFNWHWYPNDSLYAFAYTKEPPMRSTTAGDGNLCLFLSKFNEYLDPRIMVNNSVVFPPFDCSSHGTVVVSYETCFMCYDANSTWQMLMEISVDNWVHSAQYDVSFGVNHKGRPDKTIAGQPAIFRANISDVAAGQSDVRIKFTWRNTNLYFWQIDDFKLSEAWDNDLMMKFAEMEWQDDDDDTRLTPAFMIPKSQIAGLGFTNFKAAALNFGEYDQENAFFEVDITKNNQNVFHSAGPTKDIYSLITDTTTLTDTYVPVDFGHYLVTYNYKSDAVDNTPENNTKTVYFNITDSAYSYADNTAEEAFVWGLEAYGTDGVANIDHKMGVQYRINSDCEANSISAFIAGGLGDGQIDFRYELYRVPVGEEDETPIQLMITDYMDYDSTLIGKWVTLELTKDGESEFLQAGDLVYAVVNYNNQHTDKESKRYENLKIGADQSFRILDPVSVAMAEAQTWDTGNSYINERLLMIRLNINDHSNPIDGIDLATAASALGQNYPNPFSGGTDIDYQLANGNEVTLVVRDITGRVVLQKNEGYVAAGQHTIRIEGSSLESGIYMYTLQAGTFSETKRMTVTR